MNDADHDLARQQGIELGEAYESIVALSVALRDALEGFPEEFDGNPAWEEWTCPQPERIITEERVEAWRNILEQHGKFHECPSCGTPTSGGICAACAGVTGE